MGVVFMAVLTTFSTHVWKEERGNSAFHHTAASRDGSKLREELEMREPIGNAERLPVQPYKNNALEGMLNTWEESMRAVDSEKTSGQVGQESEAIMESKNPLVGILRFCGADGTRTRDLLRDRQAF